MLEGASNRYVTLSLELCRALIISEDEVLSKLHRVVEVDPIRDRFRDDSIKRRDQVIDHLSERPINGDMIETGLSR